MADCIFAIAEAARAIFFSWYKDMDSEAVLTEDDQMIGNIDGEHTSNI